MKFIAFLALAASLYAAPISRPDPDVDGQEVISPNIGSPVIPTGGIAQYWVCFNDNPSNQPGNDHDYNDACAIAEFGPGNLLTLTYDGGLSALANYIGVRGQDGWVGPGSDAHEATFHYEYNEETIFSAYVNGATTPAYFSGSGGAISSPAGDYFYTECLLCVSDGHDVGGAATPEPAAFAMVGLGLAGLAVKRFRASN